MLIFVALEDDQRLRPDDWHEWLKSIPALAKYMHIQAVYQSDSAIVFGSVPVAVWNLLLRHPAILFICFVRSNNLLNNHAGPLLPPSIYPPQLHKTVREFKELLQHKHAKQTTLLRGEAPPARDSISKKKPTWFYQARDLLIRDLPFPNSGYPSLRKQLDIFEGGRDIDLSPKPPKLPYGSATV